MAVRDSTSIPSNSDLVYGHKPAYLGAALAVVGFLTIAGGILFFGHQHLPLPQEITHAIGTINPFVKEGLIGSGTLFELGGSVALVTMIVTRKNALKVMEDRPYVPKHSDLFLAIAGQDAKDINFYLNDGNLKINAQNSHGETALIFAAKYCRAWIPILIAKGADPSIKDKSGKTAHDYFPGIADLLNPKLAC